MFPASFDYVAARSVEEALELMAKYGDEGKLLAGGHSLIPAMKLRLAAPRTLIDIATIPGLRGIRIEGNDLIIGALTVHAEIAASEIVRKHAPGIVDAASVIGDLQVRNRGTIGGSVAHADPAADFPVILTALNAVVSARSESGSRAIGVDDFFTDFYTTALEPNEILTEIRVPLPPLSEERRKDLVKLVHKLAEEGRVAVRHGRTEALSKIKKLEHVSEDDKARAEKEVQKLTDDHIRQIDEVIKSKEAEIMEV